MGWGGGGGESRNNVICFPLGIYKGNDRVGGGDILGRSIDGAAVGGGGVEGVNTRIVVDCCTPPHIHTSANMLTPHRIIYVDMKCWSLFHLFFC